MHVARSPPPQSKRARTVVAVDDLIPTQESLERELLALLVRENSSNFFSLQKLTEFSLMGGSLIRKFSALFRAGPELDQVLLTCSQFEADHPTFFSRLHFHALALRCLECLARGETCWSSIARELNLSREEVMECMLPLWKLGIQIETIPTTTTTHAGLNSKVCYEINQLQVLHAGLNLPQQIQRIAEDALRAKPAAVLPLPGELNGEQALLAAKQCDWFALPDSMLHFSLFPGFFSALQRDARRLELLKQTVFGLSSTGRAEDLVKLKSFLLQLVKQAPQLLETLAEIPNCHLDEVFQEYVKGGADNTIEVSKSVVTRILALIGSERLLDILLSLPKLTLKSNLLLQELEAREEFVALCLRCANAALLRGPDACADGTLLRLGHLVATFDQACYWADFLSKLHVPSTREFRVLVEWFQQSFPSDAAGIVQMQIQLVNASPFRKMKCRAHFVASARERLLLEQSLGEEKRVAMQVEEFCQEFDILNELPTRLLELHRNRPEYFKRSILPALVSSHVALADALRLAKPELFDSASTTSEVEEEICGCEEIVQKICGNDQPHTGNLSAQTQQQFDSLCKNIHTFGFVASGPSTVLTQYMVKILLLPGNHAGGSGTEQRLQALCSAVFQTEPFLGRYVLRALSGEILASRSRADFSLLLSLLTHALKPEVVTKLFDLLVRQSLDCLEKSVFVLGLFGRLAQKQQSLSPPPSLVWLRQTVEEELVTADDASWCAECFDYFDGFTPADTLLAYPALADFIELECLRGGVTGRRSTGLNHALYIADTIKQRFALAQVLELVAQPRSDGGAAISNDLVLALKLVCDGEEEVLLSTAFTTYQASLHLEHGLTLQHVQLGLALFPSHFFPIRNAPVPPHNPGNAKLALLLCKMFT